MEQKKGSDMIVKYNNWLNTLPLKGLTSEELNIFMTCIAIVKDHPDESYINIDSVDYMNLLNPGKNYTWEELEQKVTTLHRKLCQIPCVLKNDTRISSFVMFPKMELDQNTGLDIMVMDEFRFIVKEISKEFTRFDLAEFIKLDSKYAKNLYRQLKQFRRTGTYKKTAEEFMQLMGAPANYTPTRFNEECLKPAIAEIKKNGYFEDLKVEPIRARKRGKPVTHYEITFKPTTQIPGQQNLFTPGYADSIKQIPDAQTRPVSEKKKTNMPTTYTPEKLEELQRTIYAN